MSTSLGSTHPHSIELTGNDLTFNQLYGVALSGDTANFLAGGEYPIPIVGNFGQISVDYKRYGVSLAVTPTVLA